MEFILNQITYLDKFSSNAKLIQIPSEGQTYDYKPQNVIDAENYTLSRRNSAGLYLLPTEKEKLWLNFVPQKIVVKDSNLNQFSETNFTFFVEEIEPTPERITLPEGQIFRCVSDSDIPQTPEGYTYYIIKNGVPKQIPNYKTVEVMLAARGQSGLSIRVVPSTECSQLFNNDSPGSSSNNDTAISDQSSNWNDSMRDLTTISALRQMETSVKTGEEIAAAAATSAAEQIAAVIAESEQSQAAEEAAKAQSEADKAAAEATIAQAQAAIANANAAAAQAAAAKAASDAAIAEAEAKKAELDAKLAGL